MVEFTNNLSTEEDKELTDEFEYDKIRLVAVSQSLFDVAWRKRKGKLMLICLILNSHFNVENF